MITGFGQSKVHRFRVCWCMGSSFVGAISEAFKAHGYDDGVGSMLDRRSLD